MSAASVQDTTDDRSSRPPSLDVRGVAFAYPDGHQALHGVDLRVEPGERVALLGPNGAGKTTLVLHLNGILRAGAGSVSVGGLPVQPATLREIRRRVGIVFQDPDDQLFMPTVGDDVAFGPANFGVTGPALRERVDAALAAVDMLAHRDRSPLHLSGGQRRRVALATVLACRPEILVLDEPSSNLDPVARRELAEVLLGLAPVGHQHAHGHPRPALRPAAVPAQRRPRRRRDRGRRADPRAARRPRRCSPATASSCRSGSP